MSSLLNSNLKSKKIKLLLAYDGTEYEGWQRQARGQVTIQSQVEKALSKVLSQSIQVIASGRTDSGVHAEGQVAHFLVDAEKPIKSSFTYNVNSQLPSSISLLKAWYAPHEFHAQQSATDKIYIYRIYNSKTPNPFTRRYYTWLKKPLNIEYLNEITKHIIGEHDFKSFQTTGTDVKTTVRTILKAEWRLIRPYFIEFEIQGTGFLKQMVRNIVGTCLHLHDCNKPASTMSEILASKDRRIAKKSAPSTGLCLYKVNYPPELDNKCLEI